MKTQRVVAEPPAQNDRGPLHAVNLDEVTAKSARHERDLGDEETTSVGDTPRSAPAEGPAPPAAASKPRLHKLEEGDRHAPNRGRRTPSTDSKRDLQDSSMVMEPATTEAGKEPEDERPNATAATASPGTLKGTKIVAPTGRRTPNPTSPSTAPPRTPPRWSKGCGYLIPNGDAATTESSPPRRLPLLSTHRRHRSGFPPLSRRRSNRREKETAAWPAAERGKRAASLSPLNLL